MIQNESNLDRVVRVLIGLLGLFLALFVFRGTLQLISLLVGILGSVTGLTGFCLLYKLFGFSTKK